MSNSISKGHLLWGDKVAVSPEQQEVLKQIQVRRLLTRLKRDLAAHLKRRQASNDLRELRRVTAAFKEHLKVQGYTNITGGIVDRFRLVFQKRGVVAHVLYDDGTQHSTLHARSARHAARLVRKLTNSGIVNIDYDMQPKVALKITVDAENING
ncbi:hypothetical protein O152_gp050 [Pseudomonas phage PaBG]|uniref:hypothetical protein n=1 Tax=Pseudomonas phage PaBG TaxID=1335230 RepID=UPI00155E09A5|nr:hypothetical protein O152_gp050 [Pseudomonas phage PaBG]QKE11201.1 hypothetical protein PaBG_00050 [Pseudomonas phage PaBG]